LPLRPGRSLATTLPRLLLLMIDTVPNLTQCDD
jgi:hypothetical protein